VSVLVTGATGFVMANLARHLAEHGHAVVAADLNPPDDRLAAYLDKLPGAVTFRQIDVTDAAAVRALVEQERPEHTVHGAAITAIPLDAERARFRRAVEVNVMSTLNVLEALRGRPGRVVVVSSGSVYGPHPDDEEMSEEEPAAPRGVYPITKWAGEALARRFAEINALDLAVVRLASPFGPFERDTGSRPLLSAIHHWTNAALSGEVIRVSGPPGQRRDVVHVADVASGIAAVLFAPRISHDVYNVGWGRCATAKQTLDILARLVRGVQFTFVSGETPPWATRGPLTCQRLRDLGWTPEYDLESGVAAYLQWLRENR
jgi:UDP-glucose 4-epimerase